MAGAVMYARKLELLSRPDPCEGCFNNTRCGFELLACRSFQHYVNSGGISYNLTKVPTRQIFNEVFYDDDELDKKALSQLRKELRKQARQEGV